MIFGFYLTIRVFIRSVTYSPFCGAHVAWVNRFSGQHQTIPKTLSKTTQMYQIVAQSSPPERLLHQNLGVNFTTSDLFAGVNSPPDLTFPPNLRGNIKH